MTQPNELPTTTQSRNPWAAVRRTLAAGVAALVVLAPVAPDIARALGVEGVAWVAGALAVLAAVTRVLAIPQVEQWLRAHVPSLAAAPPPKN
jgi:energy-converting hydrogenase Eha subunit G